MTVAISIGEVPAFTNRDDLYREVMDEMDRDDIGEMQFRSALQLLEAFINRNIRVPQMEAVEPIALEAGSAPLPSGLISVRALYDAAKVQIPAVDPLALIETPTSGRKVHCIIGGALKVAPEADETVTLIYYSAIPRLTADTQTNWLLASHPDVYFYGVLSFLCSRYADDEAAAKWKALLDGSLVELTALGNRRRYGGPLIQRNPVMQTRGPAI